MNPETKPPLPSNVGTGYLIVHVTTARGAIPLEGARVNIRNQLPETEALRGDVIASLISGRGGNTDTVPLDTQPRANSLKPGGPPPFATYSAEVHLEGFYDQIYNGIPIFDGITAIQPMDLIPLPENGQSDSFTPDGTRFFEGEAPNL